MSPEKGWPDLLVGFGLAALLLLSALIVSRGAIVQLRATPA
jgi:hypothetical protein